MTKKKTGRPRKVEGADTAALIRAKALEDFGRAGFEATSLSDIADAVGVTRTTLLYYFESKERLYADVVQDAFTQLASVLLASITQGGTLRARVRAMIIDFIDYVDDRPHLAKLMVREMIAERGPGFEIIKDQGLPVLQMVEAFFVEAGRLKPKQTGLLREVLVQLSSSVMLRSASGELRHTFWGEGAMTVELATILLDALLQDAASLSAEVGGVQDQRS